MGKRDGKEKPLCRSGGWRGSHGRCPGSSAGAGREGAAGVTGVIPGGQRVGSGVSGRGEEAKNRLSPLRRGCPRIPASDTRPRQRRARLPPPGTGNGVIPPAVPLFFNSPPCTPEILMPLPTNARLGRVALFST